MNENEATIHPIPDDAANVASKRLVFGYANEIGHVASTVAEHFFRTGNASSIKVIAENAGLSPSTIRKYIHANNGFVPGCVFTRIEVPKFCQSFGGIVGHQMVDAYEPTTEALRTIIIDTIITGTINA